VYSPDERRTACPGHLCRDTEEGVQEHVALGTILGQLVRQLAEDGGTVILDHGFGRDSG